MPTAAQNGGFPSEDSAQRDAGDRSEVLAQWERRLTAWSSRPTDDQTFPSQRAALRRSPQPAFS